MIGVAERGQGGLLRLAIGLDGRRVVLIRDFRVRPCFVVIVRVEATAEGGQGELVQVALVDREARLLFSPSLLDGPVMLAKGPPEGFHRRQKPLLEAGPEEGRCIAFLTGSAANRSSRRAQ